MLNTIDKIPETFKKDIEKSIRILKEAGCKEIFLFGSLAEGDYRDNADIDLAVKGCPSEEYFSILGKLIMELDHSVDLINLDRDDNFSRYLEKEGNLLYVA